MYVIIIISFVKLYMVFFLNHTILPVENRILPAVDFVIELQPSTEVTTFRNAGEDLLSTCKSMADTTKVEGGLRVGGVTTSCGKPDISG